MHVRKAYVRTHKEKANYTHERQSFEGLCEKRDAWASPNAPLLQDMQTHKQGLHTGDTKFERLREKQGAWTSPNAPLPQVTRTHKQDLH